MTTDDCNATDRVPKTQAALLDRAQTHAADVARKHFPEFSVESIDWEVSEQAQRQAGVTEYDPDTESVTIKLTWDAYQEFGWPQFSKTVQHELVHAWQYWQFDQADHDETFDRWTDALGIAQHCERFKTPNWWVVCTECSGRLARYQHSKVVNQPENYSCGDCGGALRVEEADGG
ncbi:sprT domain-containing protein [halophilic archaeon]|nr:sprT domain-containing protein [halophilic archaeon]